MYFVLFSLLTISSLLYSNWKKCQKETIRSKSIRHLRNSVDELLCQRTAGFQVWWLFIVGVQKILPCRRFATDRKLRFMKELKENCPFWRFKFKNSLHLALSFGGVTERPDKYCKTNCFGLFYFRKNKEWSKQAKCNKRTVSKYLNS